MEKSMDYDDNDDFDDNNRDDGHLGLSFLLAWLNPSGHEGSFFERTAYYWWRRFVFNLKVGLVLAAIGVVGALVIVAVRSCS